MLMKKLLLSIVAILTLSFAANAKVWTYNAEADYAKLTWMTMCKNQSQKITPTATEGENALGAIEWKYEQIGSDVTFSKYGTAPKGVLWGTTSTPANELKFSTIGFSGKKITNISVQVSSNAAKNQYKVSASFGDYSGTVENVLNQTARNTAVTASFNPGVAGTELSFSIINTGTTTETKGGVVFLEVSVTYEDSNEVVYPTSCNTPVFSFEGYKMGEDGCGITAGKTVFVECDTPGSIVQWRVFVNGGNDQTLTGKSFTIPVDAKPGDKYEFIAKAQVQGKDDKITSKEAILTATVVEQKGTVGNPYSVSDLIQGYVYDTQNVWVKGWVIGSIDSGNKLQANNNYVNTNLAIADSNEGHKDGDNISNGKFIGVYLTSGKDVRDQLDLTQKASTVLGREFAFKGNIDKYFGVNGVKGTSEYKLLTDVDTSVADVFGGADGAVRYYDVNGREVAADAKGLVIRVQGSKAVKLFNK